MEQSSTRAIREPQDRWLWIIQELFVEVLARFGTGIIFLVLALLAVMGPAYLFLNVGQKVEPARSLFSKMMHALSTTDGIADILFATPLALCLFFVAYLAGLIFTRLDIKTPDRISFQRRAKCLYWDVLKDDDVSTAKRAAFPRLMRIFLAVGRLSKVAYCYIFGMKLFDIFPTERSMDQRLIRELMCSAKADCEFPYLHLREYLKTRGYGYLAELVPWDRNNKELRSRNIIGLLKTKIRYYGGVRAMHLVRYEANIRLLSAMWWAARTLTWISVTALIATFVYSKWVFLAGSVSSGVSQSNAFAWFLEQYSAMLSYFFLPGLALITACLLRWGITNQLHDLRMREVFQVLVTVWTMRFDYPKVTADLPDNQEPEDRNLTAHDWSEDQYP